MKKSFEKHTPFIHLPRHKRRDMYVRLRWRIRCTAYLFGGQFISRLNICRQGTSSVYNHVANFSFCGSDELTVWNAKIMTTANAFWRTVEKIAQQRAWEMLTPEEREREAGLDVKPVWRRINNDFDLLPFEELHYDKFGGLTLWEYEDQLANEIIRNEPPEIFESFVTDNSSHSGVALQAVVRVDEINIKTIEQTIERFRSIGETDWRAEKLVPRAELPTEHRKDISLLLNSIYNDLSFG